MAMLALPVLLIASVVVLGSTGVCRSCALILDTALALTGIESRGEPEARVSVGLVRTQDDGSFTLVRRGVDIEATYDLSGARIPIDEIHTLLPRDAIPAITDPDLQPAGKADWLPDHARVIVLEHNGEAVGVPLVILNWHEIVNMTLGGEPVAATYCPLCDSATAFSRRLPDPTPDDPDATVTLEFGVSGALYNSNVLMYDRQEMGLWSQLAMGAVTGPRTGTALRMLPVRLLPFGEFKKSHPGASIVSDKTGHARNYDWDKRPYQDFFSHDRTLVPVRGIGDVLPKKTLGVGISTGERAWFVPVSAVEKREITVETPDGPVRVRKTDAGVFVDAAPGSVRTAQSFYYAWSAFYPETETVRGD